VFFFLSREIPNEIFGLAILSAGGVYGDESESTPFRADDPRITHFLTDRPAEFVIMQENKEYIQPQWIFDCINNKKLLPVSEYQPGKNYLPISLHFITTMKTELINQRKILMLILTLKKKKILNPQSMKKIPN